MQVMISRGDRFVGDMQHLMLLECTFADFLEGKVDLSPPAEQPLQQEPGAQPGPPVGGSPATHAPAARCCLRAYLAQCPVSMPSADRRGVQPGPLAGLMADIEVPPALRDVGVNQINFWASPRWVVRMCTDCWDAHVGAACGTVRMRGGRVMSQPWAAHTRGACYGCHTAAALLTCRKGQSSLHYDPYQNMLVVVECRKTVWLVRHGLARGL